MEVPGPHGLGSDNFFLDLTTVRFGPPVRIGTVVKKSESEPNFRFLNLNRNLNRSISGSGSVLGIQNREPNRNRTKKNLKFFWLNRIEPEPEPAGSVKKISNFFDR